MADSSSKVEDGGGENTSSPPQPHELQSDNTPPALSTTSVDGISSASVGASTLESSLPHQIMDNNNTGTALPASQQCDNLSSETSSVTEKNENLPDTSIKTSETRDKSSNEKSDEPTKLPVCEEVLDSGGTDMSSVSMNTHENTSTENLENKNMSGSETIDCRGAETTDTTEISKELTTVPENIIPSEVKSPDIPENITPSEPSESTPPATVLNPVESLDPSKEGNVTDSSMIVDKDPLESMSLLPKSSEHLSIESPALKTGVDSENSSANTVNNAESSNSISHDSECNVNNTSKTVSDNSDQVSSEKNDQRVEENSDDRITESDNGADVGVNEHCPGTSAIEDTDASQLEASTGTNSASRGNLDESLPSADVIEVNDSTSSTTATAPVLDSAQTHTPRLKVIMPCLETEPLQPVTIGSSLQPYEEIQEQSMIEEIEMEDPSLTQDMDLIENNVDEPGSVGGLVINSVIGSADGIVDFQPDEEVETDREFIDISSSAPVTGDEAEPSAKRMRLDNGELDKHGGKKVTIKLSPVKNGHGLWDSQKLLEILQIKGTVVLRIHSSKDTMEAFEPEKSEIQVDFTGIVLTVKDDDTDQTLGQGTTDNDLEPCDPLSVVSTQHDHDSPQIYSRHLSRGRSTALQPAMARAGFRPIQSPPHHHVNHEVLGLPSHLDYEDPHMASEWAGKEYYGGLLLQRKASPPPYHHYPGIPPALPYIPARGRRRGRPPLTYRRGYAPFAVPIPTPPTSLPKISASKLKPQGSRSSDAIKYRPPTPPGALLSSLIKFSKSVSILNENDGNKTVSKITELLKGDLSQSEKKSSSAAKANRKGVKDDEVRDSRSSPVKCNPRSDVIQKESVLKKNKSLMIKLHCAFCDLVFRKSASLKAHLKHKHRGMQSCPICKEKIKVKGKNGMKFHILKNHKDQPHHHCLKCGESFKLQHHLINHERLAHDGESGEDDDESTSIDETDILIEEYGEVSVENEKREREEKERREREFEEEEERGRKYRKKLEKETLDEIEKAEREREDMERTREEEKRKGENYMQKDTKKFLKSEGELDSRELSEKSTSVNIKGKSSISNESKERIIKKSSGIISRGKVMNVSPPEKGPTKAAPKQQSGGRVTRSQQPRISESDDDDSDSDDDDDSSGNESDISSSSSSSDTAEKRYSCKLCDMAFSDSSKLEDHVKNKHSKSRTKSTKDTSVNDDDDEDDEESDSDDEEEEFRRERERKERERKAKEEALTCRVCKKVCRSDYQLKLHLPIHTVVRKPNAGKKINKSSAESNTKANEEPRKLRSGRESNDRGTRSEKKTTPWSQRQLYRKEPFDSPVKSSSDKWVANRQTIDLNERPSYVLKVGSLFRCLKCNVTFNKEKQMTYHLKKIHETLYPFRACEQCGRIFRSCGPYNRHVASHNVHHCPETDCKAKFRKMVRLKVHQRHAHPNKPFRCLKCVMLFAKKNELEKHREDQHPKLPTDDEEDDDGDDDEEEEGEGEEEEKGEKGEKSEKKSEKEEKKYEKEEEEKDEEKEEKKDDDDDDDDDEKVEKSEEVNTPMKRRARKVPISYKEPDDDEEDYVLGKSIYRRKLFGKPYSPDKRFTGMLDKKMFVGVSITPANMNKTPKYNSNIGRRDNETVCRGIKYDSYVKNEIGDKVCQTEGVLYDDSLSSESSQFLKQSKKFISKSVSPCKKHGKVNLTWTAALKAQIQAAKTNKSSPSKRNTGARNTTRRRVSGQTPMSGSDSSQAHPSLSQDLSYPGCLVTEDSMFSLDDNSQMDIIDYYGSQYPSEEISDFVPDDDDDGPAKIIGFDSF